MSAHGVFVGRLHHVSFGTPCLSRQVAFYCDVLGGVVAHEFRNEANDLYGVFIHLGGGSFIEMFNDPDAASAGKATYRHFAIEVSDINQAANFLSSKGFSPVVKRGRTDRVLQLFIHDPDGNVVELQQHDEHSALTQFLQGR